MTAAEATPETVRRCLYDMSEARFPGAARIAVARRATKACAACAKDSSRPVIIDAHAGDRALTGGELLPSGIALSLWLRKNVPEKRIGIVLPPGLGATIANLGVVLAGKIPVNLNFTRRPRGQRSRPSPARASSGSSPRPPWSSRSRIFPGSRTASTSPSCSRVSPRRC